MIEIDKFISMDAKRKMWLVSINNYNCTLSLLAHKLEIPLWKAMEIGKWHNIRREAEDGKK